MRLQVIGTGSAGNCYAVTVGDETLLLDAGIQDRKIKRALNRIPLGCLLTHEHMDHAKSAKKLARLGIPVYASAGTFEAISWDGMDGVTVTPQIAYQIGGFVVMAFETQHDAAEPIGFLVRHQDSGETLIYATDTYYLRYRFPGINYWLIECNYVEDIAESQIASGDIGENLYHRLNGSHMSLRRLAVTLKANDLTETRAIILIHLSDGRSDEQQMIDTIRHETGIEDVFAAQAGMDINLQLAPF